jgi:hypothetical protein
VAVIVLDDQFSIVDLAVARHHQGPRHARAHNGNFVKLSGVVGYS